MRALGMPPAAGKRGLILSYLLSPACEISSEPLETCRVVTIVLFSTRLVLACIYKSRSSSTQAPTEDS